MISGVVQFSRVASGDYTYIKAWLAKAEGIPQEVFLYRDYPPEGWIYDRICKYCDLVNWPTAVSGSGADIMFLRRGYAYLQYDNEAQARQLVSGMRVEAETLFSDIEVCTDNASGFSMQADTFMISGTAYRGSESTRLDFYVFQSGGPASVLVMRDDTGSGVADSENSSLLAVATPLDLDILDVVPSGSLWLSSGGTVVLPTDKETTFLTYLSGDLCTLAGIPALDVSNITETADPSGTIYMPGAL